MVEGKEELKSLLMKVKEKMRKLASINIQKTKIMTSGPISSWQIDGETMETVTELFSWTPKSQQMVTAAMKLKDTCLLLGRKSMTNLDSILKTRDITLPTKFHIVKDMVFLALW